jgi:hypothetical protein
MMPTRAQFTSVARKYSRSPPGRNRARHKICTVHWTARRIRDDACAKIAGKKIPEKSSGAQSNAARGCIKWPVELNAFAREARA